MELMDGERGALWVDSLCYVLKVMPVEHRLHTSIVCLPTACPPLLKVSHRLLGAPFHWSWVRRVCVQHQQALRIFEWLARAPYLDELDVHKGSCIKVGDVGARALAALAQAPSLTHWWTIT